MRHWALALLIALLVAGTGALRAHVQEEPSMAIDADPSNGTRPCDPIDVTRTVKINETYQIGICLLDLPFPPDAITGSVSYNRELNEAPEESPPLPASECDLPDNLCLDVNPDFNQSREGVPDDQTLGSGWNCTAFGIALPRGDEPRSPEADANITCYANLVEPNRTLTADPGLLALVTFRSLAPGVDEMQLPGFGSAYGLNCEPYGTMICSGATVTISPEQAPPPGMSEATPTGQPDPSFTSAPLSPSPETGASSASDGESDDNNALIAVVGVAISAMVLVAALFIWRRRYARVKP
jgi:hypothetical protein